MSYLITAAISLAVGLIVGIAVTRYQYSLPQQPIEIKPAIPRLNIARIILSYIRVREKKEKSVIFEYNLKFLLHNAGNKKITLIDYNVDLGEGWRRSYPATRPFSGNEIDAGGSTQVYLSDRKEYPTFRLDVLGNELPCKITINYAGSDKPFEKTITLKNMSVNNPV